MVVAGGNTYSVCVCLCMCVCVCLCMCVCALCEHVRACVHVSVIGTMLVYVREKTDLVYVCCCCVSEKGVNVCCKMGKRERVCVVCVVCVCVCVCVH
jgi:hypothetical protein